MRMITVSGNLAADPEILTKQDGTNYTKLRLGNHEYSDGKDGNTKWFTVFYPRTDGIINALKKGSGIIATGDYADNIYNSQTRGADIDRIVSAYKLDFFSTKRDDSQQPKQTAAPATAQSPAPAGETKPAATKKTTTKTPPPAPAPVSDGVDDLPF